MDFIINEATLDKGNPQTTDGSSVEQYKQLQSLFNGNNQPSSVNFANPGHFCSSLYCPLNCWVIDLGALNYFTSNLSMLSKLYENVDAKPLCPRPTCLPNSYSNRNALPPSSTLDNLQCVPTSFSIFFLFVD